MALCYTCLMTIQLKQQTVLTQLNVIRLLSNSIDHNILSVHLNQTKFESMNLLGFVFHIDLI